MLSCGMIMISHHLNKFKMKILSVIIISLTFFSRLIAVADPEDLATVYERSVAEWFESVNLALDRETRSGLRIQINDILLNQNFWAEAHPRDGELRGAQYMIASKIRRILVTEFSFPSFNEREIVQSRLFREEVAKRLSNPDSRDEKIEVGRTDHHLQSSRADTDKSKYNGTKESTPKSSVSNGQGAFFDFFSWSSWSFYVLMISFLLGIFYFAIRRRD
jgi:hypothetical protein